MKPLIGLMADVRAGKHVTNEVQQKYIEAVSAGAGALAVLLPARIDAPGAAFQDPADTGHMLDRLDGLFLPGAVSNIAPAQYGQALAQPDSPADPGRDAVSLDLIRRAVARGVPILGVCRGLQEINVALGGTLHQAVHEQPGLMDHRERPGEPLEIQYAPVHGITLAPGGLLALLSGASQPRVNSLHGQGIATLAPGLIPEAHAPDGLIEAFRLDGGTGFLLGVQWHPEWNFRDDPLSIVIFNAFGAAARARAAARGSTEP